MFPSCAPCGVLNVGPSACQQAAGTEGLLTGLHGYRRREVAHASQRGAILAWSTTPRGSETHARVETLPVSDSLLWRRRTTARTRARQTASIFSSARRCLERGSAKSLGRSPPASLGATLSQRGRAAGQEVLPLDAPPPAAPSPLPIVPDPEDVGPTREDTMAQEYEHDNMIEEEDRRG
ncbi:hypothetical protein OAO87_02580 [bacterium]|nr:hypothetical protein [bacterium]